MKFTEYEKMCNDFSKFQQSKDFEKVKWIVTEKIHGANFSFHTDGNDVRVARRRDFLNDDENFFDFRNAEFMRTYPEKMRQLFSSVYKLFDDEVVTQVTVYGELFGGLYVVDGKNLHPPKQKCVQPQIQYSPNKEWCAFDISYRLASQPNAQDYVDTDKAMKIFEDCGIFYLKPLHIGTMQEALNFELGFDSTIPKILGLPPLEKGSNKAEGVVIKPIKNLKGQLKDEATRVIVKIKLREFLEVTRQPANTKDKKKDAQQSMLGRIMPYTTPQRLANAISKIGDASEKELEEEIIKEFISDIFTDIKEYDEELQDMWLRVPKNEQDKIIQIIKKKASGLIKKHHSNR